MRGFKCVVGGRGLEPLNLSHVKGAARHFTWRAEQVVQALGRVPHVSASLGLERAGIAYSAGGIVADDWCRTNIGHIYAVGDVNGKSMLLHAAERQNRLVTDLILRGYTPEPFRATEMPMTVFTRPALMSVGLSTEAAQAQGIKVSEERRQMRWEDRALIMGEPEGLVKFVVAKGTGRVIGVHAVGIDAVSLSTVGHLIVRYGLTLQDVSLMTFPHPTQFEILNTLAWNSV
ncbi:protein of unknown function [Candidatus Hydrogenisulfobacillus filiaventi]|uniref:Dihydrolipoyl dehydrogenase n=1 Tax=Candidatus Hydrogenisulfobacillus filiaventi TaxID=2707344 RepID=A0A6F8ZFF0_9FIRM|nr:protein of unknown function [Candidatus Hydrogenisulfobacillus filiaventi]